MGTTVKERSQGSMIELERFTRNPEPQTGEITEESPLPLEQATIFHGLDDESVGRLRTVAQCHAYCRNELICRPDEEPGTLFVIGSGCARVYRLSPKGQEITLAVLTAGSVFGMMFADANTRSKDFLEATCDSTVVYQIPFKQVLQIMAAHPSVAVSALRQTSLHLEDLQDRIEDLALYDVKTRLAHALAKLANDAEGSTIRATHRELAWMVGTRPEEVTKALRHLRGAGLVTYEPRHSGITVLDVPQLESF
ncbi:MAG TPA: Crp/Fnr family transcriptional regulator [Chloroflexota bacterium]